MKLVRFGPKGKEKPGLVDESGMIRSLAGHIDDLTPDVIGSEVFADLAKIDVSSLEVVEDARLGAPIAHVGKVVCIGLNYSDHAEEAGMDVPPEPVVFMKATSALSGLYDDVELPRGSVKTDWECELAIVIGKEAKYVEVEDAFDYVAGYTVLNDISEREYQIERAGQWVKGKSHDTFAPVGPWLVTKDEVDDPQALSMWLDVNDKRFQEGTTSTMVYGVAFLISYLSKFMSLQPGDIISTGTPPGVGMGQKPQVFLKEGDVMSLGIQGLGSQMQKVVSA